MFKVNKKFKTSRIIQLIQSTGLMIVYNYWINHRSVRREWFIREYYETLKRKHKTL